MSVIEETPVDELPVLPADRKWPRPWMSPFLRSLSLLPDVSSACRVARIGRTAAYSARNGAPDGTKEVPGFAEAWDEALELAADLIQRQAHTWITTGVPIRSSRSVTKRKTAADGSVLETTTEEVVTEGADRSATLMIFWLKAWYPERYRWSERAEITGPDGGPVRIESLSRIDAQIEQLTAELEARALAAAPDEEPLEV